MRAAPESFAEALRRRGLAAPARLLLDAHRPLRPLLAETGVFLSPVLRPLLGHRYRAVQDLLEHDTTYDQLIESLDDAEHR
ncbi:MAG: hypothetical protein E6J50_06780 [Chloroflexi bacterium]|nr:MAG: hypothetical protein E6J50_06780 [Chloroflexota bacterium]